jgi:uncharacterized protein (DUF3084 family)
MEAQSNTSNGDIAERRRHARVLACFDVISSYISSCLPPSETATAPLLHRLLGHVAASYCKDEGSAKKAGNAPATDDPVCGSFKTSVPFCSAVAEAERVQSHDAAEKQSLLAAAARLEREVKELKEELELVVRDRMKAQESVGQCEKREAKARLEFTTVQENYLATAAEVRSLNAQDDEMKARRRSHISEREACTMIVKQVRADNEDLSKRIASKQRVVDRMNRLQSRLDAENARRESMALDVAQQRKEEDWQWAVERAKRARLEKVDSFRRRHLCVLKRDRKERRIECIRMAQEDKDCYRAEGERRGMAVW